MPPKRKIKKPGQGENEEEKNKLKESTQRNAIKIEALERELCLKCVSSFVFFVKMLEKSKKGKL
jgi:hypothetical protein